jgi:hypothetical protein
VRRREVERHLAWAFPDRPEPWRRRMARACYRHFGGEALATLRAASWSSERVIERTTMSGFEKLRRAHQEGKGVVLLTGHLGNWELGGAAIAARGLPLEVVGKGMSNRRFQAERSSPSWAISEPIAAGFPSRSSVVLPPLPRARRSSPPARGRPSSWRSLGGNAAGARGIRLPSSSLPFRRRGTRRRMLRGWEGLTTGYSKRPYGSPPSSTSGIIGAGRNRLGRNCSETDRLLATSLGVHWFPLSIP